MSRHRMVRTMNYEDEYFDDDDQDYYSRSVEDKYGVSPSTAAEFTYQREKNVDFSSFMRSESITEEEETAVGSHVDELRSDSLNSSGNTSRLELSGEDQARLNSCLEELQNVLGDSVPESVMASVVIQNHFNMETSLHQLLDAPKPQREPRKQRNRSQASPVLTTVSHHDAEPSTTISSALSERLSAQPQATPVTPNKQLYSQPRATSVSVSSSSSKSGVKATVGFNIKETPPSSPSTVRKTNQKQKAQNGQETPVKNKAQNLVKGNSQRASSGLKSASVTPGKGSGNSSSEASSGEQSSAPMDESLKNAVEFMGLDGDKDVIAAVMETVKPVSTPKKSKASKVDVMAEYAKRHGDKELLNLVVIGHVDAGKSTLMGHLLYQLGSVNQKVMHKFQNEAKKMGKASFAYAWVLDETDEERSRGVTMDVAQTRFETDRKVVTLLDAPGHKDFIPNMITGAAQADVGILVINATRGEFETGFDAGGQTREHALLARSLGVGQIIVAINKMDTVDWSNERYSLIVKKIGTFLAKMAGFKDKDVTFVPVSGLSGENLASPPTVALLTEWYTGGTLIQQIDKLCPPQRPIEKSFRLNVSDVFKGVGSGFNISGKVGSGYVQPGDKVMIMPAAVTATIKGVYIDEMPAALAFAGDHVNVTMSGVDMANVNIGSCVCDPSDPSRSATRIRAKVVLFNVEVPITKGFPVVFHYQAINEPAVIKRLNSHLNRQTGEVIKNRPRCLVKNCSAVVEIEFERSLCVELYAQFKDLGRFMLRSGGHTIAAGVVEEIIQSKGSLTSAAAS